MLHVSDPEPWFESHLSMTDLQQVRLNSAWDLNSNSMLVSNFQGQVSWRRYSHERLYKTAKSELSEADSQLQVLKWFTVRFLRFFRFFSSASVLLIKLWFQSLLIPSRRNWFVLTPSSPWHTLILNSMSSFDWPIRLQDLVSPSCLSSSWSNLQRRPCQISRRCPGTWTTLH